MPRANFSGNSHSSDRQMQPHIIPLALTILVSYPYSTLCNKGLAHFEPFLVFADSTVWDPGLPIRLQAYDFSYDKAIILHNTVLYIIIHVMTKLIVQCGIDDWMMM